MKKYFVLLIPLIFLLVQCRKDDLGDETLVEGTVLEYGTNKPVPNVPVKIRSITGEVFGSQRYTYTGDSTRTDSKGKYSIRFKHIDKTIYDAVWIEKRYTGDNGAILETGKRNKYDFTLNPPAWIRFQLQNVILPNSRDSLYFWGETFVGQNPNTEVKREVRGNRYESFVWLVIKGGSIKSYKDSIYCPAFDTVAYTIKY